MSTDVIDAVVVPDPGTELATVAPANLFQTNDPAEVIVKATDVANALADVIRAKGLFKNISGRSHIVVEGWQLVGAMLGVTAVCTSTEEIEGGYKATVEARAVDGRVIGRADAICTKAESLWKSRDDYARLSMAQTRATSKALKGPLGFVVSLAGYQTTPAEEMTHVEADVTPAPATVPVEMVDDAASKQLDDLYERYLKGGGNFGALGKYVESIGGDLDVDPERSMWGLLSKEQGRRVYRWMYDLVAVAAVVGEAA